MQPTCRVSSPARLSALLRTTTLVAAAVLLGALPAACNKDGAGKGAAQAPAAAARKAPSGPSYALTVEGPAKGKAGTELKATVRVVPKGGYKVNLEYPTRLKIKGPASSAPQSLTLSAKQAAKFSKKEILFEPAFKPTAAGEQTYEGTLRFSVCTKQQCEIKAEKVKWVAQVDPS